MLYSVCRNSRIWNVSAVYSCSFGNTNIQSQASKIFFLAPYSWKVFQEQEDSKGSFHKPPHILEKSWFRIYPHLFSKSKRQRVPTILIELGQDLELICVILSQTSWNHGFFSPRVKFSASLSPSWLINNFTVETNLQNLIPTNSDTQRADVVWMAHTFPLYLYMYSAHFFLEQIFVLFSFNFLIVRIHRCVHSLQVFLDEFLNTCNVKLSDCGFTKTKQRRKSGRI